MRRESTEAHNVPETASSAPLTLYRKHRPAAFDELVGQPAVVQGLTAAVKSSRVAHAYLFSGPRGTGKTSAARILAKCLDCLTNGPRPDPCGICEACTSIAAGTAFDVVEIDAASNRGINEIRELRDRVQFAPSQFRKKVYIIDEVHMLTSEAFNALLKTLEEPPEYVVFVLATTELHRVPATILSRCQRYEFRRMTPPVIAKRLEEVAEREKIALDDAAARRIAHLADGALRDALVLLEQARGFAGGKTIDAKVLDAAFGESHREIVERLVDAVDRFRRGCGAAGRRGLGSDGRGRGMAFQRAAALVPVGAARPDEPRSAGHGSAAGRGGGDRDACRRARARQDHGRAARAFRLRRAALVDSAAHRSRTRADAHHRAGRRTHPARTV